MIDIYVNDMQAANSKFFRDQNMTWRIIGFNHRDSMMMYTVEELNIIEDFKREKMVALCQLSYKYYIIIQYSL